MNRPLPASRRNWISLAVLIAFVWAGCAKQQAYDVRGRVVGFGDDGLTVIVEHQEVPGYMPAMTMPFTARDSAAVAGLDQGDAVAFRLVVGGEQSWIDGIEKLPPDALPPPTEPAIAHTAVPGRVAVLEPGDPVPSFELAAHDGGTVRASDYEGKALLVTFIYTRCPLPDMCPLLSRNFQRMQPVLAERYGNRVQLLSISFDPEHDTPDVLRAYARRYTDGADNWRFATGTPSEIDSVAGAFGIFTEAGAGEIVHNLVTALVGPDGTVRHVWRGSDWTTEEVLARVEEVMKAGAARS